MRYLHYAANIRRLNDHYPLPYHRRVATFVVDATTDVVTEGGELDVVAVVGGNCSGGLRVH